MESNIEVLSLIPLFCSWRVKNNGFNTYTLTIFSLYFKVNMKKNEKSFCFVSQVQV